VEIWRKGLEGSYWLGVSIAGHRNDMFFGTDVDSSGVGINERQALKMNSFTGFVLLFAHSF
jgi:hypothetical protein